MTKFDDVINALDDDSIKKFHNDLSKGGFYKDLINPGVLIENDINEIRKAVKVAVGNTEYGKLKEIAPQTLRAEIEALGTVKQAPLEAPATSRQVETEAEPRDPQNSPEFYKLTQKLVKILDQRDSRNIIPPRLRDEFGEIVAELNEKYGMTLEEIESRFNVTRKTVGKSIKDSKEREQNKAKLLEMKLRDGGEKTSAKARLHSGVEGAFETIEEHAKDVTKKRMEEDYTLGNYLNEKYYLASLERNVSVQKLVDNATDAYLKQGAVYKLIMDMEEENINLTKQIRILQAEVMRLAGLNKNLCKKILITQ